MEQVADNSLLILTKVGNGLLWAIAKVWYGLWWLLALPIRTLAVTVAWSRRRHYNPERVMCPACGFRGDSGSGSISCRVNFIRTGGTEKAALQHICIRCGCDFYTTKMYQPAEKWLAKDPPPRRTEI